MGYTFKVQTYDEPKQKAENCEVKPKAKKSKKKSDKKFTKAKGTVGAQSKLGKIQAPSRSIQSHGRPMTSDDNFAHNHIAEENGTCSLATFNPTGEITSQKNISRITYGEA